ncbi:hypothetical protein T4D_16272 [Trichinella pseudospiralis]|uniref:Uncharacterized protein n=1 Tax=Trichinella pseudospiralis TaxID=6337 RepID=A0A0V1FQU0_TRIPS|nr:hypothetical protein T4D_16272 [Trichinella pseudospiralis]
MHHFFGNHCRPGYSSVLFYCDVIIFCVHFKPECERRHLVANNLKGRFCFSRNSFVIKLFVASQFVKLRIDSSAR